MSNTIQSGGVGKSPAIYKINQLNALTSRIDMATKLEQAVFQSEQEKTKEKLWRKNQIIQDFSIDFSMKK